MMKTSYVCCTKKFEDHYSSQVGLGLPYYQSISNYQKGYGLGGIFRRLFKAALPFLFRGGKTIGKEAVITGARLAGDILSGQKFKEAVKISSKEAGKNLAQKAINKVQSMVGKGKYKRKRKNQKTVISSKARKLNRRDIFGT